MPAAVHPPKKTPHGQVRPRRLYFGHPLGLILIIGYKFFWGIMEIFLGLFLIFSYQLIHAELLEDPQDRIATWFLEHLHLGHSATLALGAVLIVLGIGKIILSVCLWLRLRRIRELGLIVFTLIGIAGGYRMLSAFTWITFFGFVFDLFAWLYFYFFLPKHLQPDGDYI